MASPAGFGPESPTLSTFVPNYSILSPVALRHLRCDSLTLWYEPVDTSSEYLTCHWQREIQAVKTFMPRREPASVVSCRDSRLPWSEPMRICNPEPMRFCHPDPIRRSERAEPWYYSSSPPTYHAKVRHHTPCRSLSVTTRHLGEVFSLPRTFLHPRRYPLGAWVQHRPAPRWRFAGRGATSTMPPQLACTFGIAFHRLA